MHDMIRYYLHEEPLLAQVKHVRLRARRRQRYVLEHLDKMVVKAVDEAGGYGMLMGLRRRATRSETSPNGSKRSLEIHRAASNRAVVLPNVDREQGHRGTAPSGLATLCFEWCKWHLGTAFGADARGAQRGFVRCQFESRRGLQRHLGAQTKRADVAAPTKTRLGRPSNPWLAFERYRCKASGDRARNIDGVTPMISRVAEHCFWFGRYLERAESTARLLRVTQLLELDAELAASQCWLPVITVSGESGPYVEKFGAASTADGELVQAFLVWNEERKEVSLTRSISALRSNARSIREVLSTETWEAVNEFHLWVLGEESHHLYLTARDNFYAKVRNHAQLVIGSCKARCSMTNRTRSFIWGSCLSACRKRRASSTSITSRSKSNMRLHTQWARVHCGL